jgi:peptide maturation system protein (TIGR04066 family)
LENCDIVLLDDDGLPDESLSKLLALTKQADKKYMLTKSAAVKLSSDLQSEYLLDYPTPDQSPRQNKLKKVPVPVIMVMGMGEQCQKFDLQLEIREHFQSHGYKVSQFGTKAYSALFGFQPLPDVFSQSLVDKVYTLNRHITSLVDREKPDVLILGVPGSIMPLNEYHSLFFGEMALALSHAVTPDVSILSFYRCNVNDEYINLLKSYCRYRLSVETEYFHMSNTMLYIQPDQEYRYNLIKANDISFLPMFETALNKGLPLCTIQQPQSMQMMLKNICWQLQNNLDVI